MSKAIKKTIEKKHRFYHQGEWVEMTEEEILALPNKMKYLKEDLLELEHRFNKGYAAIMRQYMNALVKYYDKVSQHMFVLTSGFKFKYLSTIVETKGKADMLVLTIIRFNPDNTVHSLFLTEQSVVNSKQVVNNARNYLFRDKSMIAGKSNKLIKTKLKQVEKLIKENYVGRLEANSDKCNTILRNWIAEIFK